MRAKQQQAHRCKFFGTPQLECFYTNAQKNNGEYRIMSFQFKGKTMKCVFNTGRGLKVSTIKGSQLENNLKSVMK